PGHGPIAGVREVQALRDHLTWLHGAAVSRLSQGASPRSIAVELARSEDFRRAPWGDWSGPERMVITIATIDRHRRGDGSPVGTRERARLFGQVAAAAHDLGTGPARTR